MFCKWCGGTLSPSDVKCSRCGREVPTLSDCGGFYDLMPSGRNREAAPVQRMEPKPAAYAPQKGAQAPKARKKSAGRGYIYLALLVFALIFVLLIVLFSKINRLSETVEELQELHSASEQRSDKETEDDETPFPKKDSHEDSEPKASEDEEQPPVDTKDTDAEPATTTEPTTETPNPDPDGE